jgi:hypothetical protein
VLIYNINKDGPRVNDSTKDLCICGKVGAQVPILSRKPSLKAGTASFACKYIINLATKILYIAHLSRQMKGSKSSAFLVGNVTTRRRHLVW